MARPRRGENPLAHFALRAQSKAVRALLKKAVDAGFDVTRFARVAGIDRRTLVQYVDTEQPRLRTIAKLSDALGLPRTVARALVGQLDDRDLRTLRREMRMDRNLTSAEVANALLYREGLVTSAEAVTAS